MNISDGLKKFGFSVEKLDVQKMSGRALQEKLATIPRDQALFKEILAIVKNEFGLVDVTDAEIDQLKVAFERFKAGETEEVLYSVGNPIVLLCTQIISDRAEVGWTTPSHTGVRVVTSAIGPGSEKLGGCIDNTDIAKTLRSFISVKAPNMTSN